MVVGDTILCFLSLHARELLFLQAAHSCCRFSTIFLVFNHSSTMTSVLARNCLSVVLAVLAMISITNLGLKITSYNFISDYSSLGFNLNPHGNDSGRPTFALPYHLYTSALNLVVASSVFSLLAALIVWISTLCAWTDRKRVRFDLAHRPPVIHKF